MHIKSIAENTKNASFLGKLSKAFIFPNLLEILFKTKNGKLYVVNFIYVSFTWSSSNSFVRSIYLLFYKVIRNQISSQPNIHNLKQSNVLVFDF